MEPPAAPPVGPQVEALPARRAARRARASPGPRASNACSNRVRREAVENRLRAKADARRARAKTPHRAPVSRPRMANGTITSTAHLLRAVRRAGATAAAARAAAVTPAQGRATLLEAEPEAPQGARLEARAARPANPFVIPAYITSRHSSESSNPESLLKLWIPAYAGKTNVVRFGVRPRPRGLTPLRCVLVELRMRRRLDVPLRARCPEYAVLGPRFET